MIIFRILEILTAFFIFAASLFVTGHVYICSMSKKCSSRFDLLTDELVLISAICIVVLIVIVLSFLKWVNSFVDRNIERIYK